MTPKEAANLLAEADLVELLKGSLSYAKEVRDHCLEAGVPVVLGDCPGTS